MYTQLIIQSNSEEDTIHRGAKHTYSGISMHEFMVVNQDFFYLFIVIYSEFLIYYVLTSVSFIILGSLYATTGLFLIFLLR